MSQFVIHALIKVGFPQHVCHRVTGCEIDDEIDNQTSHTFTISLEDLEVECGENVFIAAHAVVCCEGWGKDESDGIKEAMINVFPDPDPDPEPGEVTCETAWGFGDYTFIDEEISKKWGWIFEYTICCE